VAKYDNLGQSALFMAIRQLEMAVLQLTGQLDEMMDAIQSIIMGKLQ
jgi:regulator of replication initiation timing